MPFVRGPVKGEKKKTQLKTILYSPFLEQELLLCRAAFSGGKVGDLVSGGSGSLDIAVAYICERIFSPLETSGLA